MMKSKPLLLIGSVVAVIVIAGFLAVRQNQLSEQLAEQQRLVAVKQAQLEEERRPKFVHKSDSLVSGSIVISASTPHVVRINVDRDTMNDVTVKGRFEASGGARNDIEVFVLDQDNYTNWSNNHASNAFYQSGRTTVGNIEASLAESGVYYLVFSNNFSFLTSKTVKAMVTLEYEKRVN